MKANKLFYITMIFGLSLIPSLIWAIIDPSWWSGVTFLVLFFMAGYLGKEYANKVKKDPKAAVDSFLGKTSIIILLVGLSLGLSSCAKPKLEKPFIITRKGNFNNDGDCKYEYSDKNGNRTFFFDSRTLYNIGDTLK